jgi:O-antigen/teichoic acid export membrane protein
MTAARKIFGNTIALTIANAGQLVGNIILFFYLSRLLQAEGLGIYSTVIAIFHTVTLGCQIVDPFIPRELPKDLSRTNQYLMHGSLISVTIAIILMAGLDLLAPHLGYLPQTQTGLYIISAAIIPEALNVVIFTIFISHQKAKYYSVTSILTILGRIIASLIALRLGYGVLSLIGVYATFSYISFLMNLALMWHYVAAPHLEFNHRFLVNMLRELKYFAGTTMLNALFSQSEVIILSLMLGETQVGFYSAALKLVTVWSMISTSYMTATFPVMTATFQESHQKALSLQNRSLKYLLALALPIAVGITVTAGRIIPLFYGSGFDQSIAALRLLAWYLPLSFCNTVLYRVLYVRSEQHVVFRVQLITEIVQVLLAVSLIPPLGVSGAALALLGGNLLYAIFSIYFVQRNRQPLPLFQLSWRLLAASTLMGLIAWLLMPRFHLFAIIPGVAMVYIMALWVFRAFSSEDLALFKHILTRSNKRLPVEGASTIVEFKE